MEDEVLELRSCFGTKESVGRSVICKKCRFRKECKEAYKNTIVRFKPEMEIK